jgi:hypothetical protein
MNETLYDNQKHRTIEELNQHITSKKYVDPTQGYFRTKPAADKVDIRADIPTFLIQGTNDQVMKFPNSTSALNDIWLIYNKQICHDIWIKTKSPSDRLKIAQNPEYYQGLFDNLDRTDKIIITRFAKEVECFAGIRFKFSARPDDKLQAKTQNKLQIAFCSYKSLQKESGTVGFTMHEEVNPEETHDEVVLLVDNSKTLMLLREINFVDRVNTLSHELLHALGLAHPVYKNLEEEKSLRSLVADGFSDASFRLQECFITLHSSCLLKGAAKCQDELAQCTNQPTNLQPLDVKGLLAIWGPSYNESPYCKAIRHDFVEIHGQSLTSGNVNPNHDDL